MKDTNEIEFMRQLLRGADSREPRSPDDWREFADELRRAAQIADAAANHLEDIGERE